MIILVVGLTIGTIVFFIEFCKGPKSRKAPESAGGIEMTEQQVTSDFKFDPPCHH